ncbi:MAG: formyltransferase family protein [candidate division KSB1 bacterium]|nr:formyltransferase family protein [candidate division KSB1 bacterium]MDZ7276114.1 formyltransferase family protein [candidate division KSB1 bacterium]MDZ7287106.1 formyltransferase family protein [candidate division KSB1 bacterium]MDZ7296969.1 formyltransferase family protein [candidate division KSB1 bacterium]MDZ7306202.1 formyltransferase family protein [candidate division KSB1 bacterium]
MADKLRVGFCVSGGGHLCKAALHHAETLGIRPALLLADYKAAADLEILARERDIPFHRLARQERERVQQQITAICATSELDLLCLTFDKILPAELVAQYRGRIINVHMGLLPAFKGMHALEQAVRAGVKYAGATIHEVDVEVDSGAIIAQCLTGVRQQESPAALGARLYGYLRLMFLQVLAWYAEGRISRDQAGRLWVTNGVYGELPISPAVERSFPD